MSDHPPLATPEERARFIRARLPKDGLFAGQDWRVSPSPFRLGQELTEELEGLGRLLLQFNRSVNLLHRQSLAGKQPAWVAQWLDQGKPRELLEVQRSAAFKNELPRVIRPDIILAESGPIIAELDSVPGGIGLTAWLNQTYSALPNDPAPVIGGADGMARGFSAIFGEAPSVHIVIAEEAKTYLREWPGWPTSLERDSRCATRASTSSERVTRFIAFSNCSICPRRPMPNKYLTWRWPGTSV